MMHGEVGSERTPAHQHNTSFPIGPAIGAYLPLLQAIQLVGEEKTGIGAVSMDREWVPFNPEGGTGKVGI